ncbi:unnamed protein product [Leptidea sinapis]|uniref:Partial AB-hydrolase lipase domain-containing protein n=1 Tax=Leptidea sinapis TaxID=189913 RepID=A0A5E4QP28_9NEOP|nr:unnamed protein product [Leptidea sinapis]
MKLILVLCIAALSGTRANLLRPLYPRLDPYVVQPLDYADERPQHHRRTDKSKEFTYEDNSSDFPTYPVGSWMAPTFSKTVQVDRNPMYGDAASWRGVHIAVSKSPAITKQQIARVYSDAFDTIKHISEEDKRNFHKQYEITAQTESEETHLNATELLRSHEYTVEEHVVRTDDGYELTMFRVLPKEKSNVVSKRPIVFLMHGLLGSADDWLLMGPHKSLAYMLSDAGFEVWLGNARGSKYSRKHVSKHPAQDDFWSYSIDEVALHDLPAMIDYVLRTSEHENLYYVGHSQGNTAIFALTAARPEYNDKIVMMHALSPMVYMSRVRSPLLRMLTPNSPFYKQLKDHIGEGEMKFNKELVHTVGGSMCENEIGCKYLCSNPNFIVTGMDPTNMEIDLIPVILGHSQPGVSTRQIQHYAQTAASDEFRKYNHGVDVNKAVYGSEIPPKYNMSNVKVPVVLYYSDEDWLAHPVDVERLRQELPNVKESYRIPEEHFSNMDFQFSTKSSKTVYPKVLESIKNHHEMQY